MCASPAGRRRRRTERAPESEARNSQSEKKEREGAYLGGSSGALFPPARAALGDLQDDDIGVLVQNIIKDTLPEFSLVALTVGGSRIDGTQSL